MPWSRNALVYAFEEPGYLPIIVVSQAVTEPEGLGYEGWIMAELSSRTMSDPLPSVPQEHARREREWWDNDGVGCSSPWKTKALRRRGQVGRVADGVLFLSVFYP